MLASKRYGHVEVTGFIHRALFMKISPSWIKSQISFPKVVSPNVYSMAMPTLKTLCIPHRVVLTDSEFWFICIKYEPNLICMIRVMVSSWNEIYLTQFLRYHVQYFDILIWLSFNNELYWGLIERELSFSMNIEIKNPREPHGLLRDTVPVYSKYLWRYEYGFVFQKYII